jgi:UDP-3-O-acyl-N-acetylglucosamine deacetylase
VADGSSQGFFDAMKASGIIEQDAERVFLQPTERLEYKNGDTELILEPADSLKLTTVVMFNHPMIQKTRGDGHD